MSNNMFNEEKIEVGKKLLERSKENAGIAMVLYIESMNRRKYDMARLFAENIIALKQDDFDPYHIFAMTYMEEGDFDKALDYLDKPQLKNDFAENTDYINDRLLCLIKTKKYEEAEKYVAATADSDAKNTHSYLKCAEKLYTALRKNGELRSVLEKFEELYGEAAERLSLAMLDMADGKFAEAAERLAILTKEDTQQREYYTALSLRPICLMRMDKPGWKNEMREAAEKLDAAADDPLKGVLCRQLSTPLWETLGCEEKAEENQKFISEIQRFADDPDKYMDGLKAEEKKD